jgi:hypothetical protein
LRVADPVPTPEEQVRFLRNIQRVFAEGSFVASYKFALLHALADLAVLKGDDSGLPLTLHTREIAEKFIELYWRQVRPFQVKGTSDGLILKQNTGQQAAVLNRLIQAHRRSEGSLFQLQCDRSAWTALVSNVDETVRIMPLWKLQRVGNEVLDFLYDNTGQGTSITLKPGIAYCLRAYYGFLRDLIHGAWVRYVQKVNAQNLGDVTDLGTFLFGQERSSLDQYRAILIDVQRGKCFYCQRELDRRGDVDHFIPWSRYPSDLGHNFVLAHSACNAKKSDYLACEEHLAAWHERNTRCGDELIERLKKGSLSCDLDACIGIARWAYWQTEEAGGQVWVRGNELRHLGPVWRRYLIAG